MHFCYNSVAYLRLDGSVESEKRYDIVKAFNSDPTIDVLLLTTHGMYDMLLLLHMFGRKKDDYWLICSWWAWTESYICWYTCFYGAWLEPNERSAGFCPCICSLWSDICRFIIYLCLWIYLDALRIKLTGFAYILHKRLYLVFGSKVFIKAINKLFLDVNSWLVFPLPIKAINKKDLMHTFKISILMKHEK